MCRTEQHQIGCWEGLRRTRHEDIARGTLVADGTQDAQAGDVASPGGTEPRWHGGEAEEDFRSTHVGVVLFAELGPNPKHGGTSRSDGAHANGPEDPEADGIEITDAVIVVMGIPTGQGGNGIQNEKGGASNS